MTAALPPQFFYETRISSYLSVAQLK